MTPLQRLNPRLHIAAAIAWSVFAVVTLAALIAASLAAAEAENRARADAQALLTEFAAQVRDALSKDLESRRSVLQATAAQILASNDHNPAALTNTLAAVRGQFPEFLWLGVVDPQGLLQAQTAALQDADVSKSRWFQQGQVRVYVSENHVTQTVDRTGQSAPDLKPSKWMDFAVPIDPTAGVKSGVMGAQVSWSWLESVLARMRDALDRRHQFDILLTDREGTILLGPEPWLGTRLSATTDVTEAGAYMVGTRTQLKLADGLGLGWTAIVRQRADSALAPVHTARRTVFLIVFLAGLLSAALAVVVTRVLTRRLSQLAADAEAVRSGAHLALNPPPGHDEISRIGTTLAQVVDQLQQDKHALQQLNVELDRRVAQRTLRIEQMADETRHAAVTRERLRIARDLHDTLAHSLMALLTQIRVIRKLQRRMDAAELDAELERAEDVAATGLTGARSAITQMRDNDVQDTGLGPALQNLAQRHAQRSGLVVDLEIDPPLSSLVGPRAEAVFRILEEALRNVERHAGANGCRILLRRAHRPAEASDGATSDDSDTVVVEVLDEGVGFDTSHPTSGHYGLIGMKEQAQLIGARLSICSAPDHGTRVLLEFEL